MRIGWVGCGKLGMPCALALAAAGHEVIGVDPSPAIQHAWVEERWPYDEPGVTELLGAGLAFSMSNLEEAVQGADVVFVAVQTPHERAYDGSVPMPEELKPFDTTVLKRAVRDVMETGCEAPIVIVSTVLPGTCRDVLEPILRDHPYIYSPAFVAMGTVLEDLKAPEFILAGVREGTDWRILKEVYSHAPAPILAVKVESAELAKMAYNTAISTKIVLSNAVMEMCEETGADSSEVSSVLEQATDRIASPRYLRGGMGDGGPCHPRDAIAMAWLAEKVRLSADPFTFVTRSREAQTQWLAQRVANVHRGTGLPVTMLGRAYKPGVSLEDGSAALLLTHYLREQGVRVAFIDERCGFPGGDLAPGVFVLATPHPELIEMELPSGSVLIDPWGVAAPQPGVELIAIGRS